MGKGYNNEGDSQVDVVIDDGWGKPGYWAEQDEEAKTKGLISPMEDIVPGNPSPAFNSNFEPENNDVLFNPGMPVSQQGGYEDSGRGDMGYLQSNLPSQVYQGPQVPSYTLQTQRITWPVQYQPQSNYQAPAVSIALPTEFIEREIQNRVVRGVTYAAENQRLQSKLEKQNLREQAYTDTKTADGKTYTLGRNGRFQELMDATVKAAYLFLPEPPMSIKPFYLLDLDDKGILRVEQDVFTSNSGLINILQQHHIEIYIRHSEKTTANLLRQEFNRHIKHEPLSFYGGWRQCDGKNRSYWVFEGFSTCRKDTQITNPNPLSVPSSAFMVTAINQFAPIFDIIRTPFMREMTILLYHEAALHTLLRALGYNFSLACYFFSMEQNILAYFRDLLSWFGSRPLTLDNAHSDFQIDLLSRKDQPLLIEDCGRLSHAKKNAELLESAMVSGVAPWKNGRETETLPLQAPITLLASSPSALNCAPGVIVLDFLSADFDRERWLEYADQVGQNQDYLTAFCGYTMEHIPDLRNALAEGQKTARHLDNGQLTEECLQTFGILIGLTSFLKGFFTRASLDTMPFSASSDELFGKLLNLLIQTSEKDERTSLSEQFLEVARQLLQTETEGFQKFHKNRCTKDLMHNKEGVVLYDDNYLYFTYTALCEVCDRISQSRPVVLTALSEAGLLCGHSTNETTFQTRVTIYNVYGVPQSVSVYKFARESFETYGDPLILEEGDAQNGF